MNSPSRPPSYRARAARQRGAGIIEVMVGVLIGMIVVAVVYNVLVLAEGYKRSTIGVADAQVTGQLTQYIVGREVANGGAALMMSAPDLINCSDWRLRPLPVLITAGASANQSDQLLVYYSTSARVVHPVWFSGRRELAGSLRGRQPQRFSGGRLGHRHQPWSKLFAGAGHWCRPVRSGRTFSARRRKRPGRADLHSGIGLQFQCRFAPHQSGAADDARPLHGRLGPDAGARAPGQGTTQQPERELARPGLSLAHRAAGTERRAAEGPVRRGHRRRQRRRLLDLGGHGVRLWRCRFPRPDRSRHSGRAAAYLPTE